MQLAYLLLTLLEELCLVTGDQFVHSGHKGRSILWLSRMLLCRQTTTGFQDPQALYHILRKVIRVCCKRFFILRVRAKLMLPIDGHLGQRV